MHLKASSCLLFTLFGVIAIVSVNGAGYGKARTPVRAQTPYAAVQKVLEEPIDEYDVVEEVRVPARSSYVKQSVDDSYSRTSAGSSYGSSAQYKIDNDRIAEEQAKSAKYAFASAVDDGIMDQSQVRQETRDGLKVAGSYSYSDGFFKRTVKYEADEGGYRVVGEEVEPIGDGPQIDLHGGRADVHSQVEGVNTQYSISADEIRSMTSRDGPAPKKSVH